MSLCITNGRSKQCATPISGGSPFFYLTDTQDIATVMYGLNDEVTGVTMVVGGKYLKMQGADDTSVFTESGTNENCSSQWVQTYTQNWRGRNQDDRNTIMEFANCCCGMSAIHGENTGKAWFWGYGQTEEIQLLTDETTSGAAKSDANESVLVFQAIATKKAVEFTPGEAGIPIV